MGAPKGLRYTYFEARVPLHGRVEGHDLLFSDYQGILIEHLTIALGSGKNTCENKLCLAREARP